jgi:MFS family permease
MPKKTLENIRIRRNEGVSLVNLLTFYFLTYFGLPLMFFVSASQDFFLTTFMKIPSAEQGQVAGQLESVREFVILFMILFAGVLADKIGRKKIVVAGFILLASGYLLFPFAANLSQVFAFHALAATGNAFITGMMSTIIADYVFDQDRGKASALQGILIGLTIPVVGLVLKPLPKFFQNAGYGEITAGTYSYFVVAGLALTVAAVLYLGLKDVVSPPKDEQKSFANLIKEGISAGKDPGILLSYLSAFVSRGDLVVIGTFLTIWISNYGRDVVGLDSATAAQKAGGVLAAAALGYLLAAPIAGFLTDKLSRVNALMVAAVIGFIAYSSAIFVTNPLGSGMLLLVNLFSVAQIFGVITSQVLVSQQAPKEIRGSVIGVFGLFGSICQIIMGILGGYLFRHISPAAPFVVVGLMNLALLIAALILKNRIKANLADEY